MRALILLCLDRGIFGAGVSISTKILNLGAAILRTKNFAIFIMYKQLFKDSGKWRDHKLLKLMDSLEKGG